MKPLSILFISLATCTAFGILNVASSSDDEVDALLKWKATLHGQNTSILLPSWTYDLNLNYSAKKPASPCNWYGISCNEYGRIIRLNLSTSSLNGTLDHLSFSLFPNLEYFDLSVNNFSGIIPSEISYLSKIVYLDFSVNQFTGIIPLEIGKLRNIETLYLAQNLFNGSIPQSICQMRFLSSLGLDENNLYGSIPTCFGQLSYLGIVFLNGNNISGSIPQEFGNLYNMEVLDLNNNYLTGLIPETLVNLKNLIVLSLYQNKLNGSIPQNIGKMISLEVLELELNHLSGPIPSSLGKLKSISLLSLHSNQLSGSVPQELGTLTFLKNIQLAGNQLKGPIPSSFGNLRNLKILSVSDNQLSGSIPQELGKLKLVEFVITNNNFSGSLPDEICNGRRLKYLLVGNNKLTGAIPKSLRNCSTLFRVSFNKNQITGDVSQSFGVYPTLNYINLNNNQLYGEISDNWSKCTNLTAIHMRGNRMHGNIPTSLGIMIQLQALDLSFNDFVGEIPKEFRRMAHMGTLVLSNNRLSGEIPDLGSLVESLDLSMNRLNGSIPFSLEQCFMLHFLNLSNNGFTGDIPVQLGGLGHLSALDLSHNSLTKEIPSGLCSMSSLETLNLSHNKLSGYIPESFESMKGLLNIDLSYNHLRGPLPKSKAFMNLTIEALQGNDDLCGTIAGLKQCTSKSRTPDKKHNLTLVISLPLIGALLHGCLMVTLAFYCWRSDRLPSSHPVIEHNHGQNFFSVSNFNGRETYEEIVNRTEGFNEAYCIGMGGCGSVYKVRLSSGDILAVKRLHSSLEVNNHNDFINEIRALTRIRHRNIITLLGYCSHSQNSFLVYEYLEGGCLADILGDKIAYSLDWMKRVNIIKGVANALSYMHHDCLPPIIHRDISSKNILLDSEYEACVSDFGTSKILSPDSSNWSNIAGTFGYLAPELAYNIKITEKCDVYGFGVLVLEIIRGTHPGDIITSLMSTTSEKLNFTDLVDHRLPIPLLDIKKVVTSVLILAIKCVNSDPEIRPTMHEVSKKISSIICDLYKCDEAV